ncbi:MAG: hypothetical protein CSA21_00375 [Deltaproteobacteria bacterium]|nr:MAG: hypothetical protein CSA21_00375 [Deltaproteobacteria bacterium]
MQPLDPASLGASLTLHDIRLPAAPGWWPPAPGWWLLLMVVVVLLLVLWRLVWRWQRLGYRRQALARLRQLEVAADLDLPELLAEVSALLRRAALCAYPDGRSTTLVGEERLRFLDAGIGTEAFTNGPGSCLADGPYAPSCSPDIPGLIAVCRRWLQQLPPEGTPR